MALAVVAGALDAWAGRFTLNPDGIAFLDIADLYVAGDWRAALSSVRGPLYAWLLALGVSAWHPPPAQELLLVHLVNFVVYLGAIAAFAFFLRTLRACLQQGDRALIIWGWAMFIRAGLTTAAPRLVTPDLLVMAAMFLLAALLLRLASGEPQQRTYAALGLVLGLGYLAKEVMLPIGLVVLVLALVVVGRTPRGRAGVALAAVVFFLTAAPFVAALSMVKGRFTLGESGRVNLVWSAHPQGADQPILAALGREPLTHPPRRLLHAPAVWEFATPVPGTSPIVFDTAYWFDGARLELSPLKRLLWLRQNTGQLLAVLRRWLPAFTLLGVLILAAGRAGLQGTRWRVLGVAGALGLAPFPLYLLTYVDGRYVAGAMVLLFVTSFAVVRVPREATPRPWRHALAVAALVFVTLPPLAAVAADVAGERWAPRAPGTPDVVAAEALGRLGLRPGDGVAVADGVFDVAWARLARVRVIAAIDDAPMVHGADGTPPAEVRAALVRAGARAIVSRHGPVPSLGTDGWVALGRSGLVALPLAPEPRPAAERVRGPRV